MTHDDELIERAVKAMFDATPTELRGPQTLEEALRYAPARTTAYAQAAGVIAAVRAYDAERRASVLDVAALVERYDPDDYRDLPVAMTEPVRFKGGLTEGKRE